MCIAIFHSTNINEAAADLVAIFNLENDFDYEGIPAAHELFPSEEQDMFYAAAVNLKRQKPNVAPYDQFVEYDFS